MLREYVILGNGFDLSLGLPTAYSDFVKSHEFRSCEDNLLVSHLGTVNKNLGWVDIEAELKAYTQRLASDDDQLSVSLRIAAKSFRQEYIELRSALMAYLIRCTGELDYVLSNPVFKMLKKLNAKEAKIFNFNYTNSFQLIAEPELHSLCYHVHGSIQDSNIIFGIDDGGSQLRHEHRFIKKSFAQNFPSRFNSYMGGLNSGGTKRVIIYGHSLGPSDHDYFRPIFSSPNLRNIELTLFHYGEEGAENMMAQIDDMVSGRMAQFRNSIRSLSLVDVKK